MYKVILSFMANGKDYHRGDLIKDDVCLTWRNIGFMEGVYIAKLDGDHDE